MIQSIFRISIVIPVYNEEDHIADCLEAIALQRIKPFEVLVIDNNSTDQTATIARRFHFVRVITEKKQGVVHARNRGFTAAQGDIIGRIDADTIVPANWTEQINQIFAADAALDAISGAVTYHDFPYQRFAGKVDLLFRQAIANGMGDEVFLYGANMAIRRQTWNTVRNEVCHDAGLHEDFDLAIHTENQGAVVRFDPRLRAAVSLRRIDVGFRDFWEYAQMNPRTYARHGRTSQRHMYPAITAAVCGYWILKFLHRSYDEKTHSFSWQKLWIKTTMRVNPATFVE